MDASIFLHSIVVVIHALSGVLALLSGLLNMVGSKKGKRHRAVGSFFVFMMLTSALTGILLALTSGNWFLTVVGIFTAFMAYTGWVYQRKNNFTIPDVVAVFIMAGVGIFMTGYGIGLLLGGVVFGLVHVVFGGISLVLVRTDILVITKRKLFSQVANVQHISRMTGAFIAALTAFLVVNSGLFTEYVPGFVIWLLPTVLFTPFAVYWSHRLVEAKLNK